MFNSLRYLLLPLLVAFCFAPFSKAETQEQIETREAESPSPTEETLSLLVELTSLANEYGLKLPNDSPLPLGSSGLALSNYQVHFHPEQKRVAIEAEVSLYPVDPWILRLRGKIDMDLQNRETRVSGKLMLGPVSLGKIADATISETGIQGTLQFPGQGAIARIDQVGSTEAKFSLDKSGLKLRGTLLFSHNIQSRMELMVGFDGKKTLQVLDRLTLPGLQASASWIAEILPYAKSVRLESTLFAKIDLGEIQSEAKIRIVTLSDRRDRIRVAVEAFGGHFHFSLRNMSEFQGELIRRLQNRIAKTNATHRHVRTSFYRSLSTVRERTRQLIFVPPVWPRWTKGESRQTFGRLEEYR